MRRMPGNINRFHLFFGMHFSSYCACSKNFTFKCHRDAPVSNISHAIAVNAISFHPVLGTFSTAGSDGTFHFWDKEAHQRLKAYHPVGCSITASKFNGDGNIFAYGVSYDWSKGHAYNTSQYPTKVMLHQVNGEECNPRALVKGRQTPSY
jgi:mRNA export factor